MHSLHSSPILTMSQKQSAELLPFKSSTLCVTLAASKSYSTNLKCQLHPSNQNFDNLEVEFQLETPLCNKLVCFPIMVLQNESGKQIKEVQRQKVYQELDKRCTFHPEVHASSSASTPMPLLRKSGGAYNLLLIISAHCNAFPCIFCYYFSRVAYSLLGAAEGSQNKKKY